MIDAKILREFLRLDEAGRLFWLAREPRHFYGSAIAARRWNARNAGQEAFTATNRDGYKRGQIMGRQLLAHRVIWALVHGEWPPESIDHINHNPADNRLENLRLASASENMRNRPIPKVNKSGAVGIRRLGRRWHAYILDESLGCFDCFGSALMARKAAEMAAGFHENHGRLRA